MRAWDLSELESGRFTFLNENRDIGFPPDWVPSGVGKLWLYNLHYFEYIWSLSPDEAARLVVDWIDRHPFGGREVGWEPYPLSLRLQNWIGYFLARHRDYTLANQSFQEALVKSVLIQAATLQRNLEFHLLGNHLLENAASLAMVESCLGANLTSQRNTDGLSLLDEQLREQVLADGCHFERSPMYQSRLTYLLSQLAATNDERVNAVVHDAYGRMRGALAYQTHPDGEIALFNDSAFDIAPRASDLGIEPAGEGCFALPEAGYYGSRRGGDYIICDAGPVGPDYLPGHAHGDIFSFELSLNGSRVVVDAGVFGYEADDMRRYCRSTRAHNTVEVAGLDQCEFWGSFRVARRGRPSKVRFDTTDDGFTLEGEHDGYARLTGKPVHHRRFRWRNGGILVVKDRVDASRSVEVVSRLHLHPDCEILHVRDRKALVAYPAGRFVIAWQGDGLLDAEESWYCPEFGIRMRNRALAFRSTAPCESGFCLAPEDTAVSFDA